ncbi:MAG: ECF transporter S component [bacterium]
MHSKIQEIATVGIFSAMAYAGGILFLFVPNVEIVTAIIFLSGFLLGSKNGILVGVIAQTLFSTFNPFGMSPPPLFVAQILNRALVGYVGGQFAKVSLAEKKAWLSAFYLGVTGLLLTWLFDIMTDFSSFFQSGFSLQQMKVTFVLGLGWYLVHGVVNTLIFAIVLPFVIEGFKKTNFVKQTDLS